MSDSKRQKNDCYQAQLSMDGLALKIFMATFIVILTIVCIF